MTCSPQSRSRRSSSSRRSNGPSPRIADRAVSDRRRSLPSAAALFSEYGHEAIHVDAFLPARTPDSVVANSARDTGRCLVTGDFDFSDVREFPPRNYNGIVVLTLPDDVGSRFIEALVREFLTRLPELGDLRGKLVIVEPGRIRVRE